MTDFTTGHLAQNGYTHCTDFDVFGSPTSYYRDTAGVTNQSVNDAAQAIIDAYSPLPDAQAEAKEEIKAASVVKRLEYVTDAPGKDAEYKTKEAEAVQFELDATVGIYMQARVTATGETAQQVADVWNAKSLLWRTVGASISSIEDKAVIDLDAETEWINCVGIAQVAIAAIEAV